MTMRIHDVPADMISDFWPLVSPLLERAVAHNPHMKLLDVLQLLMGQFGQLIVCIEGSEITAAAVIERVRYPMHVVGNVLLLAGVKGTMGARIDSLIDHMERWAKSRGCDRIAFIGLPGLTRLAKRRGAQHKRLVHAWRDL